MPLIIAAFFLISCAPAYITSHGLKVYGKDTVSKEEVELATEVVLKHSRKLSTKYNTLADLKDCSLTYVIAPFECEASHTGWCNGSFIIKECELTVVKNSSCVAQTSTAHELIHMLNWLQERKIHPHNSPLWFEGPFSVNEKSFRELSNYCENR